jgi:pyruvate/2-oxoglutarate dehydrogenase complex dihydrolipoamide dehydrogenase (E3) component
MSPQAYDAIVIGAGQGGGPLSSALARAGLKTALIEREHVGGTCINEGCTPTKTLVASARVAYLARRARDYGVKTGPVEIDLKKVRQRKRDIVESFRGGSERRINETPGLDMIRGEARFTGPKAIQVNDQQLTADKIFINTGARPSKPPIPGLEQVPTLDSTSIMELDTVPEHLLVLGGGYVGLEFGQMFRRFGSQVTVVQRGPRLLAREDQDVAEAVADILREDGITVLLQTDALRVEHGSRTKPIQLFVQAPDGDHRVEASHLLVAVGRVPNTEALNLPATGVSTDKRGFVPTNDRLETSVEGIYALGDVRGGPAFTHISYDDFRVLKTTVVDGGSASVDGRLVPYTVFIDPQLGRIGMTEEEARASGRPIQVATMPMNYVARALEVDESRGFMKAVVDAESGQILGAAVLGIEGGELMAMLEIAILGKLPFMVLRDAVFAHPTLAESFNNLFASMPAPIAVSSGLARGSAR